MISAFLLKITSIYVTILVTDGGYSRNRPALFQVFSLHPLLEIHYPQVTGSSMTMVITLIPIRAACTFPTVETMVDLRDWIVSIIMNTKRRSVSIPVVNCGMNYEHSQCTINYVRMINPFTSSKCIITRKPMSLEILKLKLRFTSITNRNTCYQRIRRRQDNG